jgi:glutamate-1-semialdehyde 2,1-aminomutase
MATEDVCSHVAGIGGAMQQQWRETAERHGIAITMDDGYPCLAHFAFDHPQANALKTLLTQEMLKRGYLASTVIYPTLAHTDAHVAAYGQALDEVFGLIAPAIVEERVSDALEGPEAHIGFRRLL